MPCMCHYQPDISDLKEIKRLCEELVRKLNALERIGDPIGCNIKEIHKLIDHLYTGKCDEKGDV